MSWILTGVPASILASLAAGLGASIVLLYVLKVRRRRVQIPFSPLWRKLLDQRRPAKLWQRLKWIVSLLIQLLLLVLILVALGDPRSERAMAEGRSVVLLVDTSASMTTLDEEGARTRMERAIEEARATLDALGPRDEVMLVRMDGQLRPLTPFVDDFGLVEEQIAQLEPTATSADIREAMRFAVDSLVGRPRGAIVLISDAAFRPIDRENFDITIPPNIEVVHVPIGQNDDNIGITAFNVRRYPSNRTNYEVYVQLRSWADVAVTVELSILGEGHLVHVEEITLAPEDTTLRIYPEIPSAGDHLEARVRVVAGDVVDRFTLDDNAYALLPENRALRVLLVTTGNLYLEGPLLLNESIEVDVIDPVAYTAPNLGDPSAEYDVTIFDRVAPPVADVGHFLYFAPSGDFSPWTVEDDVVDPIVHSTERGHPLLRWISGVRDVNIARARHLELDTDDHVVASAIGGAPIIVTRETMRTRLLGVAFDVTATDLPLRVAWPVFLLNALDWFTRDDASLIESFHTGETWFVPIDDRTATTVSVTAPSGEEFTAQAYDGTAVFYGDEVGFYRIATAEREIDVAGNLADSDESRIGPPEVLGLGDIEAGEALTDASLEFAWDPWVILVGLAFLVFIVEWSTWNRRVTV